MRKINGSTAKVIRIVVAIVVAAVLPANAAWAATVDVIIPASSIQVEVRSGGDLVDNLYEGTTIPTNTSVVATLSSSSYSATTIHWNQVGNATVFSLDFDQSRTGAVGDWTDAWDGFVFKASQDATYSISGNYSATTNSGSGTGHVLFYAELFEWGPIDDPWNRTVFFRNAQESEGLSSESFTLGNTHGSDVNELVGSPNGNLLAGHYYVFTYQAQLYASSLDDGATALGNLTLTIGDTSAVPEPGSLVLWSGLGAMGLIATRRRKRAAQKAGDAPVRVRQFRSPDRCRKS